MSPVLLKAPTSATPPTDDAAWSTTDSADIAAGTPLVSETAPTPPSLRLLRHAIEQLAGLPQDWDGYGATPPTPTTLTYAWLLSSQLVESGWPTPQVFPTRSGGFQLEWQLSHASLEWEIDPDLATGVFIFDDHRTDERIDGEIPEHTDALWRALTAIAGA